MGDEYVPERDFRNRTYPVLTILPHPLKRLYYEARARFGVDIANFIIYAYQEYGTHVAAHIARKILSFRDFGSLMTYLESMAARLSTGKNEVARRIFMYKFNYYHDQLLTMLKKGEYDEDVKKLAVKIFITCARVGVIAYPACTIKVARYLAGKAKRVPQKCMYVYDVYRRVTGAERGEH